MTWQNAFVGGSLIGLSATVMLVLHGRVTGISGIINATMTDNLKNSIWRILFISGLLAGGYFIAQFLPDHVYISKRPLWIYAIADLLVGFGTVLGNGCTSGHGVCGISRMSLRSMIATITFILVGVVTTYFTRGL